MNILVNNLTSGMISDLLYTRLELDQYKNSAKRIDNFEPLIYGGARVRAGSRYIGSTDGVERLESFVYADDISYILAFGEDYIRFIKDKAIIEDPLSPGDPYEVATTYEEEDLFDIVTEQINDVVIAVHPDYAPATLSRFADDNWTYSTDIFDYPPMLSLNETATTLYCSAVSGTAKTLTASTSIFNSGQVGAYFELTHRRDAGSLSHTVTTTPNEVSSTIKVKGAYSFYTVGTFTGTILVQSSFDGGTTWETVKTLTSASDSNYSITGTMDEDTLMRIKTNCSAVSTCRFELQTQQQLIKGLVKVTGYTSGTVLTVSVINTLDSTSTTDMWKEGAFSTYRGFPRVVTQFQQRLIFIGTANNPKGIWMSKTSAPFDFEVTDQEDSSIFIELIGKQNIIQWATAQDKLLIGSFGEEIVLRGNAQDEAISISNPPFTTTQSSFGSARIQAIVADDITLFVQRSGIRLFESGFDWTKQAIVSSELTKLSPEILGDGVKQLAYKQNNTSAVYALLNNGTIARLTYVRLDDVKAWSRINTYTDWTYNSSSEKLTEGTQSVIKSIAIIPSAVTSEDEVWCLVERVIDGSTVYYYEVFEPYTSTSNSAVHVDSAIVFTSETATTTVTGLDHLEGEYVAINNGGASEEPRQVVDGEIELATATTKAIIGLPIKAEIEFHPFNYIGQTGPSYAEPKAYSDFYIVLKDSIGGYIKSSNNPNRELIHIRSFNDYMDEPIPLFNGDMKIGFQTAKNRDETLTIGQNLPLPFTITGLKYKIT